MGTARIRAGAIFPYIKMGATAAQGAQRMGIFDDVPFSPAAFGDHRARSYADSLAMARQKVAPSAGFDPPPKKEDEQGPWLDYRSPPTRETNPFDQFDPPKAKSGQTERTFEVRGPDGEVYEVKAADERQAVAAFKKMTSRPGLFDDVPAAKPPSAAQEVVQQLPVGLNEGLANVAGLPVNAMTWLYGH